MRIMYIKFLVWQTEGRWEEYDIIRSYNKSCKVANDDFMVWHEVKYSINVAHYYLQTIFSSITLSSSKN